MTTVYVPRWNLSAAGIAPRSAIVGTPVGEYQDEAEGSMDYLMIDYEGNVHGAENIRTFADRCLHAADRHTRHLRTVARRMTPANGMTEVGVFDGEKVIPNNDGAAALLRAWIGSDDPAELEVTR